MNLGASPPSLFRRSAPTPPRARGLRLPRCLGVPRQPAINSGASPPSLSGRSAPAPPQARGLRLPRCPGALHRLHHGLGGFACLVVQVLIADLAKDSRASPHSSSGCSSPTSPQAQGLDTPCCLGTTRRHRVTRSPRRTATSSPTEGLLRADRIHRRRDGYCIAGQRFAPPSRPHTPPLSDPLPTLDGYYVADRRLAPSSQPHTPPPSDPLPAQDGYCVADRRLAPSSQPATPPLGDPLPAQDSRTSASLPGGFLPVHDGSFTTD
uniref:Uncharacterized protein n=1 Tax=Oryza glumipatula TaxID=40148 RepID=A0A0D9ZYG0_9ORYZ